MFVVHPSLVLALLVVTGYCEELLTNDVSITDHCGEIITVDEFLIINLKHIGNVIERAPAGTCKLTLKSADLDNMAIALRFLNMDFQSCQDQITISTLWSDDPNDRDTIFDSFPHYCGKSIVPDSPINLGYGGESQFEFSYRVASTQPTVHHVAQFQITYYSKEDQPDWPDWPIKIASKPQATTKHLSHETTWSIAVEPKDEIRSDAENTTERQVESPHFATATTAEKSTNLTSRTTVLVETTATSPTVETDDVTTQMEETTHITKDSEGVDQTTSATEGNTESINHSTGTKDHTEETLDVNVETVFQMDETTHIIDRITKGIEESTNTPSRTTALVDATTMGVTINTTQVSDKTKEMDNEITEGIEESTNLTARITVPLETTTASVRIESKEHMEKTTDNRITERLEESANLSTATTVLVESRTDSLYRSSGNTNDSKEANATITDTARTSPYLKVSDSSFQATQFITTQRSTSLGTPSSLPATKPEFRCSCPVSLTQHGQLYIIPGAPKLNIEGLLGSEVILAADGAKCDDHFVMTKCNNKCARKASSYLVGYKDYHAAGKIAGADPKNPSQSLPLGELMCRSLNTSSISGVSLTVHSEILDCQTGMISAVVKVIDDAFECADNSYRTASRTTPVPPTVQPPTRTTVRPTTRITARPVTKLTTRKTTPKISVGMPNVPDPVNVGSSFTCSCKVGVTDIGTIDMTPLPNTFKSVTLSLPTTSDDPCPTVIAWCHSECLKQAEDLGVPVNGAGKAAVVTKINQETCQMLRMPYFPTSVFDAGPELALYSEVLQCTFRNSYKSTISANPAKVLILQNRFCCIMSYDLTYDYDETCAGMRLVTRTTTVKPSTKMTPTVRPTAKLTTGRTTPKMSIEMLNILNQPKPGSTVTCQCDVGVTWKTSVYTASLPNTFKSVNMAVLSSTSNPCTILISRCRTECLTQAQAKDIRGYGRGNAATVALINQVTCQKLAMPFSISSLYSAPELALYSTVLQCQISNRYASYIGSNPAKVLVLEENFCCSLTWQTMLYDYDITCKGL